MKISISENTNSCNWNSNYLLENRKIDAQTLSPNFIDISKLVHDINSPINLLNLMLKKVESKLDLNDYDIIERQLHKISVLVNQLTTFYLNKNAEYNCSDSCSLNIAIDKMLIDKSTQYSEFVIKVNKNYDTKKNIYLNMDYCDLLRILSNIINNSIDASINKKVFLKFEYKLYENSFIILKITDNGKGISEENLKKIGFYGVSIGKENNQYSGFGIGLFSVRELLKKYHGELYINSQEGLGTTVSLKLPYLYSKDE